MINPSALSRLAGAAVLALASATSQAALVDFSGSTDSGPLIGSSFSGSFAYDDAGVPALGEAALELTAFSLSFAGQAYGLGDADYTPLAWFKDGALLGVEFVDLGPESFATRPGVQLTAGFNDVSEANFSYFALNVAGAEEMGFGTVTFAAAVPEPASLALMLGGLALLGASARRRQG